MTCEHYWRDGIVLAEREQDDPHREGCLDCARAHASRQELLDVLPLIGAEIPEDPYWQARVWERIHGPPARAPWRWRWQLAGALAAACAIALWLGVGRERPGDVGPYVEISGSGVPMRSITTNAHGRLDAHINDRLRAVAGASSDIWIYRADRLTLQCSTRQVSAGCVRDTDRTTIQLLLSVPGTYEVIITAAPFASPPGGRLDDDVAALERAEAPYHEQKVVVR